MTQEATVTKCRKKKTSSISNPRKPTLPSTNSSASITNASSGSGSVKLKSLGANAKTSSRGPSTTASKKSVSGKGKFAFQGTKVSRPNSQPSVSDEPTAQERLFSLTDLQQLAQIVRESPYVAVASTAGSSSTARTTAPSRLAKKTIAKKDALTKAAVRFTKKNGQPVELKGRAKKVAAAAAAAPVPASAPADFDDMPSLAGYQNPYSYAFT